MLRYKRIGLGIIALAGLLVASLLAMNPPRSQAASGFNAVWYGAAPYVMPLANNPPDLTQVMAQSGVKAFTLSFIVANNGCVPAWETDNGLDNVSSDTQVGPIINAIRQAGGDVSVSFGGFNGTKLGQSCGNPQTTAAAEQQIINKYGLRAIDLDLEEPEIENSTAINNELAAAKILEDNNPGLYVSVTIPSTMTGANFFGNLLIQNAVQVGLNVNAFSIMPFDFGGGSSMAQPAITAAEDFHQQLKKNYPNLTDAQIYQMTGLSLMNGRTDQGEFYQLSDFQTVLSYAQQHQLARLTFWSVNRDRQCNPPNQGTTSGTCSSVPQNDWDYTRVIVKFAGGTPPPSTPTPTPSPSATATVPPTPTATPTPPPPTVTPTPTPPAGVQPWDGNFHPYKVGDLVSFQGHTYKCIQAHTSQPDWTPAAVPALWQLVS